MDNAPTPQFDSQSDFDAAIASARKIKAAYVDERLQWYKSHKVLPRVLYRLIGIATVILSVTLPALTAAQFANKDLTISCISIVIAAFTGLGSFYHWDRTWQKNATSQATIEGYLAKWELELARAQDVAAPADRIKHIYDATDDLITNTSRVISSETQDFFNNLQPAQQNTTGKAPVTPVP